VLLSERAGSQHGDLYLIRALRQLFRLHFAGSLAFIAKG
jgi:hypothetical protein